MKLEAKLTRRTRASTRLRLATPVAEALATERGPRVRARTLTDGDVVAALEQHHAALKAAQPDDLIATTTARGGFVPNSYGFRADADEVRIVTELATGATTITATRGWAQSRRYGNGDPVVSRLRRSGQPQGRIVC